VSEFDPRTTALLERLAPAAAAGPDAWADVVRRSERRRRWGLTRRRTLVLALAIAALAAATASGGVHGLVSRYFPGEGHETPLDIQHEFARRLSGSTVGGVRESTWLDARAIRRVAHFSTPGGTFDFYVAPLTRPGSLCTLTVEGRSTVVDQWCNYPPAGRRYGIIALAQTEPGVWTIAGRTPTHAPIGSATVRFQDGTVARAARGPGWFVFLVDPARLRPGHRPVSVDITRTDGTRPHRFEFFPLCIKPVPKDVHGVLTSCNADPENRP
jgi:hypothetical protein